VSVWRGFLAAHGAVTRSLSEELEREHQLSVSELTDQRANCVSRTAAGCSLYAEAAKGHRARVREVFLRRLDPAESAVLLRVWGRLLS